MRPSLLALLTLLAYPAYADNPTLTPYGETRLRLESDMDGVDAAGQDIPDRHRARPRLRLGLRWDLTPEISLDVRGRLGPRRAHQGGYFTALSSDDRKSPSQPDLDRWMLRVADGDGWLWLGRNDFPFWDQNEVFWDPDATLIGTAGSRQWRLGAGQTLAATAGAFALPVGMRDTSGHLLAGELLHRAQWAGFSTSVAAAQFRFLADRNDPDGARLLNGDGTRDYGIWTLDAILGWTMLDQPWQLGLDMIFNTKHYSASDRDAFTRAHRRDREGYVFTFAMGDLNEAGHWLAAYHHAYIEALSVNASYAQDDWVRWGVGGETAGSGFRGHQFGLGYAFSPNFHLLSRLYLVEALNDGQQTNRARLDINYRF